ncbi:Filamin-B [Fukomys damarensis]|uniref:Filamin-B n=1 Tax=Fukomys damarensis TaxID=885580 RepID=A0A091CLY9_FUKDA|nr:Filamin-B [Fukomys damarensis]
MPVTEKDLAEDAPWKKIQQNTFTRWCNEHLKCVNKRIGNLQTDLSDGLRLIALLEVLSQKHMYRKYHQRPTFRQMQLENVSVALEFLDRESIKLVSIGPFAPLATSQQSPEVSEGGALGGTHLGGGLSHACLAAGGCARSGGCSVPGAVRCHAVAFHVPRARTSYQMVPFSWLTSVGVPCELETRALPVPLCVDHHRSGAGQCQVLFLWL